MGVILAWLLPLCTVAGLAALLWLVIPHTEWWRSPEDRRRSERSDG